jgi:protocatechuate 3,4-dioxygenase beta subunit
MNDKMDRSRREALSVLGVAGLSMLVGCGDGSAAAAAGGGGGSATSGPCVLKPAETEGPYFVDERLDRQDIRSDPTTGVVKDGARVDLTIRVSRVDGQTCAPFAGATVDLWQCDATGSYSDESAQGSVGDQSLRGYQVTDHDGKVSFVTIFPGWYVGRTVHIHLKIRTFASATTTYEFTTQIYFDEAVIGEILADAPYAARGPADTTNAEDSIYATSGGSRLHADVTKNAGGYAATFEIAVATS